MQPHIFFYSTAIISLNFFSRTNITFIYLFDKNPTHAHIWIYKSNKAYLTDWIKKKQKQTRKKQICDRCHRKFDEIYSVKHSMTGDWDINLFMLNEKPHRNSFEWSICINFASLLGCGSFGENCDKV